MKYKQPEIDREEPDEVATWANIGSSHKSINMAITETLRQAILSGKFKTGERLTEVGLAKTFDVSRNPVREALRVLEVEGLVEISPRKGARVALLSLDEIQEIIELRAELDGMSAKYAAKRSNNEVRAALQQLLKKGDKADSENDEDILAELNHDFHNQIAIAGKNRFLLGFMKALNDKTQWIFANRPEYAFANNWKEHAEILRAVISGDGELAFVLAKRHVEGVGREIAKATASDERPTN